MEFTQKIGMFQGKLRIIVGDDDILTFRHERFLNKTEHRFLLDSIDPQFDVFKSFSLSALILSTTSLALAILSGWYGSHYFQPPDDGAYLLSAIILISISVISGFKAYKSKINLICFNDINGRRIFSLLGNKPREADIRRFCESLKKKIERIKYNGEISPERMAGILERHVAFLHEHQVLNEQEAQNAIERIREKQKPKIINLNDMRNV
ncbi:hypothetical protein [Aquipseudomonas alcaligenes]|uniref:hypothetical protein n=1 Tax=Aquipseudomonas alcaligenes TaxID=43263 RepID=UPI000A8CA954|nr:hypothetical protein [Pseudomonas alcaligenes]